MGANITADRPSLADAEEALRLAQVEPERARTFASAILSGLGCDDEMTEVGAVAERALGLAARELDDLAAAAAHLRRSVDIAVSAGLPLRAAQGRMSLALTLAYRGESEEALHEADLAAPALPAPDRARLALQRALILQRLGRLDEALEGYRVALPLLRRAGSPEDEARLLANRGVAQTLRGDLRAAEHDLKQAAQRFEDLGLVLPAAKARHNVGFVAARRGDIPAALKWYDHAEVDCGRLGVSRAIGLMDRCETLLSVCLVPEAVAAAEQAAKELEASGMKADLAQAQLLLAQAVLLDGDPSKSAEIAATARCSFLEQNRPGWAAWASYAYLSALWASGDCSPGVLRLADKTVSELLSAGWVGPAVDARLITARIALALGLIGKAEEELNNVSAARRTGPADVRARAWHAEALLRHARGDRRGAAIALRTGMGILARHQATLGATELRVYAARRAEEMACLGLRLALGDARADRVLAWAERGRASALWCRPALPPDDKEIADLLGELRQVVSRLEDEGFAAQDTAPLVRRRAVLESQIRRRTWHVEGQQQPELAAPPTVRKLSDALGDAVLFELLELDGELYGVTVSRRRARLHPLGAMSAVEARIDAVRFALRRLASLAARGSRTSEAYADASRALNRLLVHPVSAWLGDGPVIIVPTGPLHALPWSSLPSLRGRPVSVAPSAALWMRATAASGPRGQRTVLISGPGLTHGDEEIAELARLYPEATVLTGSKATTVEVVAALHGADLVHIAAHGNFRADNPLFSCLELVDGPLTVYDLERVRRVPARIVLSACDTGQSFVAGDELMGLSSALLSLGARTLIASMLAVSDEVTRSLMTEFHRGLQVGASPAAALARAQLLVGGRGDGGSPVGGFICFGGG